MALAPIPLPPLEPLLAVLDMAGVTVFAVSGALAAARIKQTIVTFAFFAVITGVGGGTLRDLLIGAPVFWVGRSDYLAICLAAAAAVWLLRVDRWPVDQVLLWFDALGLGAYAVLGAAKALELGVPALPAIGMGVLTASFGGIIRDLLAGVPSILLRREIYVSAAALGAGTHVLLMQLGAGLWPAAILGAAAGFGLRALAITTGLALPGYKPDAGD
jgi:uncharacterized membrane protein YeiH